MNYNTAVTVSCIGDGVFTGDNVITCIKGTEFDFEDKPKCDNVGRFHHETGSGCYPQKSTPICQFFGVATGFKVSTLSSKCA